MSKHGTETRSKGKQVNLPVVVPLPANTPRGAILLGWGGRDDFNWAPLCMRYVRSCVGVIFFNMHVA